MSLGKLTSIHVFTIFIYLGHSSGARCVDEAAALVDGDPLQPLLQFLVVLLDADLQELLPAEDALLLGHAEVLHDGLEVGQLGADGQDLVQLLLVLHHHDVDPAVLRDVLAGLSGN